MKKPINWTKYILLLLFPLFAFGKVTLKDETHHSWIRINLMGYQPASPKVAVWVSKGEGVPERFELLDRYSGKVVYTSNKIKAFGSFGPFKTSARLDFTDFTRAGRYIIRTGATISPEVIIDKEVYRSKADFALRYMRQQRSGFNPYLKDSCHTNDGYTMYGPMPDSTHIDVSGGWHDASDYLQYSTTSANATYHLLAAYRDFPKAFQDHYQDNGLVGMNGKADVLDEANWGLKWLLKMHPRKDWMFNQIADDRDHQGLRLPTKDNVDYGMGNRRPVYFANGKPQGLGKFKNRATGTASIAGKFSSAFALGSRLYQQENPEYAALLREKALSAYAYGRAKPGTQQTAPNRAPYFYEEDSWNDDMELAAAELYNQTGKSKYLQQAFKYAGQEPVTPWMGADTARHYQWYPFHNFGHHEISKTGVAEKSATTTAYYKQGLERVWEKAQQNAFYRGVPFIWCSNNLTASFTIQAFLYQQVTADKSYDELAQANFDWLFGCNPWGTSMVYGLPVGSDTPIDPHSAFTFLNKYPIDGGLVDGPVYGKIYNNLIGIKLYEPDEYEQFQSELVVYHDDFGDYSTNEPTMDGTASLIYLLAAFDSRVTAAPQASISTDAGALIRGTREEKKIALVFTADEHAEGAATVTAALNKNEVQASFFLTGKFYENPKFSSLIQKLKVGDHYLGPHSDQHLLYCDWKRRDSLLLNQQTFQRDLEANYQKMAKFGITKADAPFFLPPYEWHNEQIAKWTEQMGLKLINYSPGTRSNADYTWPEMGKSYRGSAEIYQSITDYEAQDKDGLKGFILLMHMGTDERRTDKFYNHLDKLLIELKEKGYQFVRINELPGVSAPNN